jgi:hypothetical protein
MSDFASDALSPLPFKGRAGVGMVFETPSHSESKPIPTQTLPLKGRA